MATPNSTFTEMVSTTMRLHRRKVVDNVIEHNALLRLMKSQGNFKTENGGYEITLPLAHSMNSTYQRFSGFDALNQSASEVISAAKFDWMQAAIHVVASGREIRMNSGEEAMIKLVEARKKIAVTTATNKMSIDVYSDGALSNQIGGLAALVTTDGTGTVGGIVSGTYTFWKNKFEEVSGSGATFSTLKTALNNQIKAVTKGADTTNLIVMSHDFHTVFENGLTDLQRYAQANTGALGFETLKYKSADVIFDDNSNFATNAEKAYMLNTKYLYMIEHADAKWGSDGERIPTNQDAVVVPMFWMGNMATDNRRMNSVVIDAA